MVGVTDANGNPVTDASGNPVTQLVTTVTPVAVPVTDASGNAVTGNTIYSFNNFQCVHIGRVYALTSRGSGF